MFFKKVYINIYIYIYIFFFLRFEITNVLVTSSVPNVCSKTLLCSIGVQNIGTLGLVSGIKRTDTKPNSPAFNSLLVDKPAEMREAKVGT